jgi:TfoX/Sxy family transcriptional regulator of competence genes
MAKMKWTKPSAETVAYFERIAPGPPIEARRMFGMPARFLNGHVLVGVFGNTFMLHLSETDREACIRAGAKPFAPMGREAREYVDVAPGTFDDRTLKEWIVRGMRYLGSLPPKVGAKRGRVDGDGEAKSRRGAAGAPRSMGAPRSVAAPRSAAAPSSATSRGGNARGGSARGATEGASSARAGNATAKARRTAKSTPAKGRAATPGARRPKSNAAKSSAEAPAKSGASAGSAKPKKTKTRVKTAKTRRRT